MFLNSHPYAELWKSEYGYKVIHMGIKRDKSLGKKVAIFKHLKDAKDFFVILSCTRRAMPGYELP